MLLTGHSTVPAALTDRSGDQFALLAIKAGAGIGGPTMVAIEVQVLPVRGLFLAGFAKRIQ